MEFPDSLSPAAVENLEKVLPGRPVTDFNGEEEESMLEVCFVFRSLSVSFCFVRTNVGTDL